MGRSWRNAFASVRLMMVQEFHLSHHNTYLPVVPLRSIFDHLCPRLAEEPSPSRKKDADIAPSGGDPGPRTTLSRIAPPQGTDTPERRRGEVRGPGREGIRSPEKRGSAVRCSFRPAGHVTIRKTGPRCSPTRRESCFWATSSSDKRVFRSKRVRAVPCCVIRAHSSPGTERVRDPEGACFERVDSFTEAFSRGCRDRRCLGWKGKNPILIARGRTERIRWTLSSRSRRGRRRPARGNVRDGRLPNDATVRSGDFRSSHPS